MRCIDGLFLKYPFYGSRQMVRQLRREGTSVGHHRVRRLIASWGLEAIYRAPRTSTPHPAHWIYPYLLKGLAIDRPNRVWCADIAYIPVQRGFLYLVAVMDWATRHVLAWRLSNTMDAGFYVEALTEALARQTPTEAYGAGRPVDLVDKARALPTSSQAQQQQRDVINRFLAAPSTAGIHLNFAAKLSNNVGRFGGLDCQVH